MILPICQIDTRPHSSEDGQFSDIQGKSELSCFEYLNITKVDGPPGSTHVSVQQANVLCTTYFVYNMFRTCYTTAIISRYTSMIIQQNEMGNGALSVRSTGDT